MADRPSLVEFARLAGNELQPWQERLLAELETVPPRRLIIPHAPRGRMTRDILNG